MRFEDRLLFHNWKKSIESFSEYNFKTVSYRNRDMINMKTQKLFERLHRPPSTHTHLPRWVIKLIPDEKTIDKIKTI